MHTIMTPEEALAKIRTFFDEREIRGTQCTLLLAVSGGMDSMCLLRMIADLHMPLGVAHVNYKLRGEDSDLDERIVREYCLKHKLPFHLKSVELKAILEQEPGNLQQRAREIRYAWFDELCTTHGYDYMVTAHHADDSVETALVNLIRGTGIKGLCGIPAMRDNVLRPMLSFTRDEIRQLTTQLHIPYREDVSNQSPDYLRNRIRHQIMPRFIEESPDFIRTMVRTQERLKSESALLTEYLDGLAKVLCNRQGDRLHIDRGRLRETRAPEIVLLHLIGSLGFTFHQCNTIVAHTGSSGTWFFSSSHQLLINRDELIAVPRTNTGKIEVTELEGTGIYGFPEGTLILEKADSADFSNSITSETVDADKMKGKLGVRGWKPGDVFYPLGAGGRQKLQDFFTNEKLSLLEKAAVKILTCDDDIVWICGRRLDDRFKVTGQTTNFIRLEWIAAPV